MNVRIPATATAMLLALAAPAYAEIITVEYDAIISGQAFFPNNTTIKGVYTFDSEAVGTIINPESTQYPTLSHTIELTANLPEGPITVVGIATSQTVQVSNNVGCQGAGVRDTYSVAADLPAGFTFTHPDFFIHSVRVQFTRCALPPNDALISTDLPLTDADMSLDLPDHFTLANNGTVRIGFLNTQGGVAQGTLTSFRFLEDQTLHVACGGFKFPFAQPVTLPRKVYLPILLRATLVDEGGAELGPETVAPPVVNVSYNGTSPFVGADPNTLVASVLRPTEGNAFVWNDASTTRIRTDVDEWLFALNTKPYSQPGTYTVSVMPGDASYAISPTCSQTFVRK